MQGAGGGRPPKPPEQRRHRNKPAHETVELPAEGRDSDPPPPLYTLDGRALELWNALWAGPEATQWSPSDAAALTRMVALAASPDTWLDDKLLGRLLALEDRFGLNPYARRQLRWILEDPQDADGQPTGDGPSVDELRVRRAKAARLAANE